ncbi:MAG: DUF2339 domain-containing protein [Alphaproteobacteria bacterium]|nr:DUF2339 domain-containing protein [Alphaproteobacteria bacterium]
MDGFGLLISVVAFILGLVALNKLAKLETRIAQLKQQLAQMGDKLQQLQRSGVSPPGDQPEFEPVQPPTAVAEPLESEATIEPLAMETPEPLKEPERVQSSEQWHAAEAADETPSRRDMEQTLASRWFVWIGGLAIAIGGLLFVKYAYDNDLLSPELQIVLGLIAGVALVVAGEWVRLKASGRVEAAADFVPAALSAAGLATLFGSIYAAYALYQLIAPLIAFGALAAVGLGSLALSRRQGPFIAALGLLGSYSTPALIPSADPNAWGFFPYLLVILVASLATLRNRTWWWLGYGAVAGAAAWTVLWIKGGPFEPSDVWPVGLFTHLMGLISFFAVGGRSILSPESGDLSKPRTLSQPLVIGLVALAAEASLLALLIDHTGHGMVALVLLAAAIVIWLAIFWAKLGLSWLAPVAMLLLFVVLMSWQEAAFHDWAMDERGLWFSVPAAAAAQFLRWMLAAAVALGLAGVAGSLFNASPRPWGLAGAAAAFLFIWGAWARIDLLLTDQVWAAVAAILAIVLLCAVWLTRDQAWGTARNGAAGFLAAGAAAVLVFALDRMLDDVALTLAIAALAAAFALSTRVLSAWLIGPVTTALATLTTLRLFISRELWNDDRTLLLGQHWVLYGYGIPVVLFAVASRWLRAAGHLRAAAAAEGISLGLLISLISLEIRVLIGGGFIYDEPEFLEVAAHVLTWLGAAYGLMYRQRLYSSIIALWGARLLIVLAVAAMVGLSLLALNPIVTEEPVPGNIAFNALFLAYAAPLVLIYMIARRLNVIRWEKLRPAAGALALILVFVYVTLETKRVFQGPVMVAWPLTIAEAYAYSAVWLGLALLLFATGIKLGRQYVRYAGLGVMVLVVLKVFLSDMSNLEGLYRIASFIGLGLCLVGIGWLYQRFVQRPREPAA